MSSVSEPDYRKQWDAICSEFSFTKSLPIMHDGTQLDPNRAEQFSRSYVTMFDSEFATSIEKVGVIIKRLMGNYVPGKIMEIKVIALEKCTPESRSKAYLISKLCFGMALSSPFSVLSVSIDSLTCRHTIYYLEKSDRPNFKFDRKIFPYAHQAFDKSRLEKGICLYGTPPCDVKCPLSESTHAYMRLESNDDEIHRYLQKECSFDELVEATKILQLV